MGKTTTAFNLSWKLAEKGYKVLTVDLDSQCNLTGLILGYDSIDDEKLSLFYANRTYLTLKQIVEAFLKGVRPLSFLDNEQSMPYKTNNDNLYLLPGYIGISEYDSQITVALKVASGISMLRYVPDSLPLVMQEIAKNIGADYIVYDLSPNIKWIKSGYVNVK